MYRRLHYALGRNTSTDRYEAVGHDADGTAAGAAGTAGSTRTAGSTFAAGATFTTTTAAAALR